MRVDILTIFPAMLEGPLRESILKRAQVRGILQVRVWDIREFTQDKHHCVDDYPFGGGVGMVMKPEPIFRALDHLKVEDKWDGTRVILLSPQGEVFCQAKARELARYPRMVLICGHYEGVDERVREYLVDEEISLGDFVLTGGELPALVVVDAVARLLPGVLGKEASTQEESFSEGLLEYPQYTRPREYSGYTVPEVLVSGDHERIRRWRRRMSLVRTRQRRPDLLEQAPLNPEDLALLQERDDG